MGLNITSIDFIKEQSKKRIIASTIKSTIFIGIIQFLIAWGVFSSTPSLIGGILTFIPTYILLGVIIYEIISNDYKKSFLYEYAKSFDKPDKVIASIISEIGDGKVIGKTVFTKNWIISKKNYGIDHFVNYNHIGHVHFGLYSNSINFIPVSRFYTMYVESGNNQLPFQVGGFQKNCDKAVEIINEQSKKQFNVGKII